MDGLLREIAEAAAELPEGVVEDLCRRLVELPAGSSMRGLALCVTAPGARSRVAKVLELASSGELAPSNLVWALRAAAATVAMQREQLRIDLVWTGPLPSGASFRRTDQALLELIRGARRELLIVTFVASHVPEVRAALQEALDRGVSVDLVLESKDQNVEELVQGLVAPSGGLRVWEWPEEKRPRDEHGNRGCLHAKCAVADREVLLVSSANLTGHAMNLNMELGVLVMSRELAERTARIFEELIRERNLAKILS